MFVCMREGKRVGEGEHTLTKHQTCCGFKLLVPCCATKDRRIFIYMKERWKERQDWVVVREEREDGCDLLFAISRDFYPEFLDLKCFFFFFSPHDCLFLSPNSILNCESIACDLVAQLPAFVPVVRNHLIFRLLLLLSHRFRQLSVTRVHSTCCMFVSFESAFIVSHNTHHSLFVLLFR